MKLSSNQWLISIVLGVTLGLVAVYLVNNESNNEDNSFVGSNDSIVQEESARALTLVQYSQLRDAWPSAYRIFSALADSLHTGADSPYTLFQAQWFRNMCVITCIKDHVLKGEKGVFTVVGWRAKEVAAHTYLVSFEIERDGDTTGYYWEASLTGHLVRYVSADTTLAQHYGIRSANQGGL